MTLSINYTAIIDPALLSLSQVTEPATDPGTSGSAGLTEASSAGEENVSDLLVRTSREDQTQQATSLTSVKIIPSLSTPASENSQVRPEMTVE